MLNIPLNIARLRSAFFAARARSPLSGIFEKSPTAI
jgi:hypothetical protein